MESEIMPKSNEAPSIIDDEAVLSAADITQHGGNNMPPNSPTTREDRIAALCVAIREGDVPGVKSLLSQQANNQGVLTCFKDERGYVTTLLHVAVREECSHVAEIVGELIKHATNQDEFVHARDEDLATALHCASGNDRSKLFQEISQVIKQLLEAAKDKNEYVTIINRKGQTALHQACQSGNDLALEQLLEAVKDKNRYATMTDTMGRTALHYASRAGNGQAVERLLVDGTVDKNDYVTATDNNGCNTLHHIPSKMCPDIIGQLIEMAANKGAYLSAQDVRGYTALHIAAECDNPKAAERLIEKAADESIDDFLVIRDNHNNTALHIAAYYSTGVMKALLECSTDIQSYINLPNGQRRTSLHLAAFRGNGSSALLLLQKGADPALKDMHEQTAWDLAYAPEAEKWDVLVPLILKERIAEQLLKDLKDSKEGWIRTNSILHVYTRIFKSAPRWTVGPGILPPIPRPQIELITFEMIEVMGVILHHIRQEFQENQDAVPYLRTREPSCVSQILDFPRHIKTKTPFISLDFISLVMPVLFIGEWSVIEHRQEKQEKLAQQLLHCGSEIRSGSFFETHTPVTLDEYCNPTLSQDVLSFRNRDQVLSRSEESTPERKVIKNELKSGRSTLLNELWDLAAFYMSTLVYHRVPIARQKLERKRHTSSQPPQKIILVSQAWVWKIGRGVITTDPATLGSKLSGDYWSKAYDLDPFVFITLLLSNIVEHFGSPAQGADKQLLRTYENALVTISEEVNQYTKHALVEDIDLDKEKSLSHQIKHLREELSMIKSVISEQEEVWNEWLNVARPNGTSYQPQDPVSVTLREYYIKTIRSGRSEDEIIERQDRQTRAKFSKYRRRITKIEQDAERVEHNISVQLELKQKHATIKEAHSTAILSATVFGFTIITVIFAPLSFVVALFALPIDEFKKGKYGDDDVFSSSYIAKWVVTTELVSIAVTLIAMWAALRFADLHVWGKKGLREAIRRNAEEVRAKGRDRKEAVEDLEDKDPVRGTKRTPDVEQGIEMADLHTLGQTS